MDTKIIGYILVALGALVFFFAPVPFVGGRLFTGGLVLLVVDRACNAWGRK